MPVLNWSTGFVTDVSQTWSPGAENRVAHALNEYGALIPYSMGISFVITRKMKQVIP